MVRYNRNCNRNRCYKNLDRRIKKIEGATEVKYSQLGLALTGEPSPAPVPGTSMVLLNGLAQSLSFGGRIGEEVMITGMTLRGIVVNSTARLTFSTCRLMVFWWRPPIDLSVTTDTPLVVGDSNSGQVCIINTNSSTTAPNIYYPYSMENVDTYDIVYDKLFTMNPQTIAGFTPATGATSALTQNGINIKKKFRFQRKVRFVGPGADVTDMAGNSLWIAMVSGSTNQVMTFNGVSRITFKDS